MKIEAVFKEQGLRLVLHAETEAEKKMIGAVLGLPSCDRYTSVESELLMGQLTYEGHWSNKQVETLTLSVLKKQPPA